MIDKKYKRNRLFNVGQTVKISRDLSSFYSVHYPTTENLEKFFHWLPLLKYVLILPNTHL